MQFEEKGVSEVIGTLLMLVITVVLFSSIFYYVATIPTPQSQIYSTFSAQLILPSNNNGTFNITIKNNAGEALLISTTELIISISNPSHQVVHMLTYPQIYSQLLSQSSNYLKGYFAPGMNFTYHSWWDNIYDYNSQMIIHVYLIDIQNNQVVWNSVLQGIEKPLYIIGISYNPSPFPAVTSFIGKIFAYVIYNNQGSIPKVTISIPKLSINNQTMLYYNQYTFEYSQPFANLRPGNYTVWINATLNNIKSSYQTLLPVLVTSQSFIALKVTSITLENPEPVHGSSTIIFISITNPFPENVTFYFNITDNFPSYPNGWQYIYTSQASQNDPTGPYTIPAMTSTTYSISWFNIGGNYVAAGEHVLSVNFVNVNPFVPTLGKMINVSIFPKIIFVGYDFPNGVSNTIYNYYYNIFTYVDFPITIYPVTTSKNVFVDVGGYDFVIWVMGSNQASLNEGQYNGVTNLEELENLLSEGGSLLFIGNSTNNYNGLLSNYIQETSEIQYVNTTVNFYNLTKISPNSVNIPMSLGKYYTANISAYPRLNYVIFSYINTNNFYAKILANFSQNVNPVGIYGVYNTTTNGNVNHGKFVLFGYQTTSMLLYQQYYPFVKILYWLSNLTVLNGVQDIALVDMVLSNYTPVFMQPVNITFYIQNYSPTVFNATYLEFLVNGQPITVLENGRNVSSTNIYVPPIPPDGNITKVTVTWYANITPGTYRLFAYINPYHSPPEINYNNNVLSSNVNIVLNVRFSVLFLFVCGSNDKYNYPTSVNSTLQNYSVAYKFLKYNEQSSSPVPNLINPSSPYYFLKYNLVIIDFNKTGTLYTSTTTWPNYPNMLAAAINKYMTQNPNIGKYPTSLLILGEGAGIAIDSNQTILNDLELNQISVSGVNSPTIINLYGNNNTNTGFDYLGNNLTRGYGIEYNIVKYKNIITPSQNNNEINLLQNSGNVYAILENISGVTVGIVPLSLENFKGIIQEHSIYFGPPAGYGAISSKYIFMLNMLGAFHYFINYSIPEVLGTDINVNSKNVMINQYYIISGLIRNLGNLPFSAIINAYDGNQLFSTQTVFVPGLTTIPYRIIWDPQYPSPPNLPRHIRIVISSVNSRQFVINKLGYNPFNLLKEGILDIPVYIFYDDFSSQSYFTSYDTVWGFTGVNYYNSDNNLLYSAPPYAIFGPVNQYSQNNLFAGTGPSGSTNEWLWISPDQANSPSGGYALGVYYNYNKFGSQSGYYYIQTENLYLKESNYALLELDAKFELSNGGEGVMIFASPSGSSQWYWLSPLNGYPANVNVYGILPANEYQYPSNSQYLVPAFSTVSGGQHLQYVHYVINLTQSLAFWGISLSQTSSISIRFVLVVNSNYPLNIYGNDFFYMDNVKVIENGQVNGAGSFKGDVWKLQNNGNLYFMNNSLYPLEIDNLISVPISIENVIWAKMDFYTDYQIWARYADSNIQSDVPNGINVYVGTLGTNGEIFYNQLDTRWAGEAGMIITKNTYNQWAWASQIYSVYYIGMYAFHQPEVYNDINLTSYIGQSIYLKFQVHGDTSTLYTSTDGYIPTVTINGNKYDVDNRISTSNQWFALTDIIIVGYSPIGIIQTSTIWT
ncbi:MAG: type IV pilin N-terminal domain-containing protein [Thermoplasmata archaeon]